jgi:uncharacterized protein
MLIAFFCKVRHYRVPCTLRELLDLHLALQQHVVAYSIDDFYIVSRTILVKDESYFDKFDLAFADYFRGLETQPLDLSSVPDAWLTKQLEKILSEQEKQLVNSLGGFEQLLNTLAQRLKQQQERHQGGNKWIGTGGTSPFGAYGYNPEGIRLGQSESRHRKAIKVWDKREFRDLDNQVEIGTRGIKLALRKLRQFARAGASDELNLSATISATARNGGYIDIKMQPIRHNAVKLLVLFDIGGSMDDHVQSCEQLFSAIYSEFKHLEFFYFHNCVYEQVWQNNQRRHAEGIDVMQLLHTYGRDYKVIFVGDATMGPYEITYPGGSVEHWNQEPGSAWLQRITDHFAHCIWLNPQPNAHWHYYPSIKIIQQLIQHNMFPLTLDGLTDGIKALQ